MSSLDTLFGQRRGLGHFDDEAVAEAAQIEQGIESVRKGIEAGLCVFAELYRLERARHHNHQIADCGVDALACRQVPGFEGAHHCGHMDAASICHSGEAPQAIAAFDHPGIRNGISPLRDGLQCEASDHVEIEMNHLDGVIERDHNQEGDLVLRTPADFVARSFTPEIGVIQLNRALAQSSSLLPSHGVVELVVRQHGRGVTLAKDTLKGHGRDTSIGLNDQVDGHESSGQLRFDALHQSARSQRSVIETATALVELAGASIRQIVVWTAAHWTTRTLRPTRTLYGLSALALLCKSGSGTQ